jgi:hypothetical protein
MFYFPFFEWDVILPIDELHHFSRWLVNHQPVDIIHIYMGVSLHGDLTIGGLKPPTG